MSNTAGELAEKLRLRKEKAEGGDVFESVPDKSQADVKRSSISNLDRQISPASDGQAYTPRGTTRQDFASVMSRQKEKMVDGSMYESNPAMTRAHASAVHGNAPSPDASAKGSVKQKNGSAKAKVVKADDRPSSLQSAAPAVDPSLQKASAVAEPSPARDEAGESSAVVQDSRAEPAHGKQQDVAAALRVAGSDPASDSSDEASDDGMPQLAGAKGEPKQNRAEKKSRKAVSKLGMKPLPGITRVTVKKAPKVLFVIERPEVFKSPSSDTYIIFGEAKIEDLSAQAQASAAEGLTSSLPDSAAGAPAAVEAEEDEDDEVDDSGVEPKDIELVINQANVSRAKAVRALKANNNDIVEAIMALSSG